MTEPTACVDCLRRSWLLASLGPYIEKVATGEVGSRSPELLRLSNEDLVAATAPKVAGRLLGRAEALDEAELCGELAAAGCWACCRHGDLYPVGLRDAADAPWALICRGDPRLLEGLEPFAAVTIVGSRRATSYGREVARDLGRELAAAGLVVVSGLAFGIDACAHRGAVDAGRTIAVLGCGPDIAYPAAHRSLWRRISETDLVISVGCEPGPDQHAAPRPAVDPAKRNALIRSCPEARSDEQRPFNRYLLSTWTRSHPSTEPEILRRTSPSR